MRNPQGRSILQGITKLFVIYLFIFIIGHNISELAGAKDNQIQMEVQTDEHSAW